VAFQQELLEIRGCKTTLKRGGSGAPLLYLHGASGAAMVQPFMEELAKDHDVLVPEHPGFGSSDEPQWLDNIHDLAYYYLDFLEHLNLRDVTVVGSSIGGWLALEIAVRNLSRIRALSVIGAAGIYVPGLKRGDMFLWNPEERVRNLFVDQTMADRILAMPVAPEQVDLNLKNQWTTARLAWEPRLFDPHLSKWLHRINVPTQVIWGDSDQIFPAGYAAEMAKLIPGATSHVIAQCGHLPQVEKPQEFLRLFRSFTAAI